MELEIGMYVRHALGIDKIEAFEKVPDLIIVKNGWLFESDVIKYSPKIIDLIEVGDVIVSLNGSKHEVFENVHKTYKYLKMVNKNEEIVTVRAETYFYKNGIKAIVTKEQFESMEYEVK